MDYLNASRELSRGRNGQKKIGNNTYLHRIDSDTIAVKLHATDVVLIHSNNTYTLNSGGWRTVTTKARINQYSPARLSQMRGIWYVGASVYEDGMKVDSNGEPINPILPDQTESHKRKLDRTVSKYIKAFCQSALDNGLDTPSNGDCWGCLFKPEGNDGKHPEHSQPMGFDHFFRHFEESYYVPSLVLNAIRSRGYRDAGLIWSMIQSDLKRGESRMLRDILISYFKKLKPALLEEFNGSKV